jgi:hypothetical protein
MPGIFGQVFTAFQSLLSRAFWFGSFLPVALFAALNLMLAPAVFPNAPKLQDVAKPDWALMPVVLVGLVVVAYALGPLIPLFRELLDGRGLPEMAQRALIRRPQKERRRAEDDRNAARNLAADLVELQQSASLDLQAARAAGVALGTTQAPLAIEQAEAATAALANRLNAGGLRSRDQAAAAVRDTAEALRRNSSVAGGAADGVLAPRVAAVHGQIIELLRRAREQSDRLRQHQEERLRDRPADVQPTEVGNVRARSERYCREMYGVDFNYIWSRLQLVIAENEAVARRIEAAKALIDFAVLSLVLTTALVVVWLPLLALRGRSPWLFLIMGALGPLLIGFFYRLVVETQLSFGNVMQGVVDRFRFDLLKMLHIKPPATLGDERVIWRWLEDAANGEPVNSDVVWMPPT